MEDQLDAWRHLSENELLLYIDLIQLLTKCRSEYNEKNCFTYQKGRFEITDHETPEFIYQHIEATHESLVQIGKCLQTKGYHCFFDEGKPKIRISWEIDPSLNKSDFYLLATHPFT